VRLFIGAGLVAIAAAAHACQSATQVTLEISLSGVTCKALLGDVQLFVTGDASESERRANSGSLTTTAQCSNPESRDIGTLVITPGESGKAAVIVVVGIRKDARTCTPLNAYDGCVVARRTLAFREHVSATLPIVIEPACVDIPCSATTTCARGTCITSEVDCNDDGTCASIDERGRDDGGAPIDGATDGVLAEASPDGALDGATDAPTDSDGGPVPGVCPAKCVNPNNAAPVDCQAATSCCQHAALIPASASLACQGEDACRATGIQLCCQGKMGCPVFGEVCCFRFADQQMEPHGTASCVAAAACAGGTVRLCSLNTECENLDCNEWLPFGYTTNLKGCLP